MSGIFIRVTRHCKGLVFKKIQQISSTEVQTVVAAKIAVVHQRQDALDALNLHQFDPFIYCAERFSGKRYPTPEVQRMVPQRPVSACKLSWNNPDKQFRLVARLDPVAQRLHLRTYLGAFSRDLFV